MLKSRTDRNGDSAVFAVPSSYRVSQGCSAILVAAALHSASLGATADPLRSAGGGRLLPVGSPAC